jgi:sugar-specific transcriptional regulator TrmB
MNIDLTGIGISNRDKRIYEALLGHDRASIRALAEHTAINRGTVYESLKTLVSAGLVTFTEVGARRYYVACDPERLHEIISERRQQLRELHTLVDTYAESLAVAPSLAEPGVNLATFYEGDEGIAAILKDVLTTCRTDGITEYVTISSPTVSAYMYRRFPRFSRERDARGISVRIIGLGRPLTEEHPSVTRRTIGDGTADSGCYTLIYGPKVAMIAADRYGNATGIIIDNRSIANLQRLLFESLWQSLA